MLNPSLLLMTLVCLLASPAAASPTVPPAVFPAELQGIWNPAPYDCGSSPEAENDMRFEVAGPLRMNHEDIETALSVSELPGTPQAWRLTTASNVVGDAEGQSRIYVLGARYLFVTDGDRMDQYLQCR